MSEQSSIDLSTLSAADVDESFGRRLLTRWAEREEWLPDGFPAEATVESTRLIVYERTIERSVVVEERTVDRELSPEAYEHRRDWLRDTEAYRNRTDDVVDDETRDEDGKWTEGTLEYEVPGTHRRSTCTNCPGSGQIPCPECGSDGRLDCPECEGSGRQEHLRDCAACDGSGWTGENQTDSCDRCGGSGSETIRESCDNCNGSGKVTCPTCRGDGNVVCQVCEGEGVTHKLDVLVRDCTYQETVSHTAITPDTSADVVPERLIENVSGTYVRTEDAPTDSTRPRHEKEIRHVHVVTVEYTYREKPLLGSNGHPEKYTIHYADDTFHHEDHPESRTRRILPIIGAILLVILVVTILVYFFVLG